MDRPRRKPYNIANDFVWFSVGMPKVNLQSKFLFAIGSVFVILIVSLFLWMSQRLEQQILDQVDKQAKILWAQLALNQEWVAQNPDVVGDLPIVVTKKLSKMAETRDGYKFRITSLLPVNPENAPNDFEREALQKFERGSKEASRVETQDGVDVYRYMAPLYVTDACLKCHAYQGYVVGDVRGGLSVMIPMQEAEDAIVSNRIMLSISALIVLGLVLGALYVLVRRVILQPVRHLHTVAQQIESGNYATRSLVRTGDEFESLGNAFNQMLSAIVRAKSFDDAVLENVPSGVVAVDPEGKLTFANRAAATLMGISADDMATDLQREFLIGDLGMLAETARTGQTRLLQEIRTKRKDGKDLIISVSTSPLRDESGEITGAVGVLTDLTEVKAMDGQRAHLDRLAALGQLAGSIAHEINNPLQGILSGLGLVADPDCDQAQRRLYVSLIRDEVERIARIIQQMLDFYRPSCEVRVPTNFNALMESVLVLVGKQLQNSGIKLTSELDKGIPDVLAVSGQVRQVLLNIILNAIEAMPEGGHLRVATRAAGRSDRAGASQLVIVEVSDTGGGIPPESLNRIFDPFYTTKAKGTGLGLSVSYGIIKSHGGSVEVDSEVGKGTCFVVKLPASRPAAVSGGN